MTSPPVLSEKRQTLCSRVHAHRVAERLFDERGCCVSIVRTDTDLQPFRVITDPEPSDHVELEMRT